MIQETNFGSKMSFRTTEQLSKEECERLLLQDNINSFELEQLIQARLVKHISFNILDVRELNEWHGSRIKYVNFLVPTTSLYEQLKQIENQKELPIIVYCHIGQRSAYCQKVMREMGFKTVVNLSNGIAAYQGELEHTK